MRPDTAPCDCPSPAHCLEDRAEGVGLSACADGWVAYANLGARGPETEPEVVHGEALRILKQQLRELLNRLETEEVVP